jgi:hypothetical protein
MQSALEVEVFMSLSYGNSLIKFDYRLLLFCGSQSLFKTALSGLACFISELSILYTQFSTVLVDRISSGSRLSCSVQRKRVFG